MVRALWRVAAVTVALPLALVAALHPAAPAAAADRCAWGDPFSAAFRDDVARRFGGHNITASAYDQRTGCLWHLSPGRRVGTASVVKVEIGAGVLLRAQQAGRGLTPSEAARLWPMITESANPPTTSLWTELGGAPAMARLDRAFGLTETTPSSPSWGLTTTSAADQVRLLRQVVLGEGGPLDAAHRAPLIAAMGAVVPSQRWGISAGAPAGSDIRLKNGFAASRCCAWRINSVGVVTTAGHPVALAVLSDHWPSMGAGIEAVEMVARQINTTLNRPRWVGITGAAPRTGTLAVSSDGRVAARDGLTSHGDATGIRPNAPVVGIAATPSGEGTWLAGSDGGVFAFGDAPFFGSMGGQPLNRPIVGIDGFPTGRGYRLVASDGGVFAYNEARFFGSMGGQHLNRPIVGIATTPSGLGYWLVALDGGIFAFGDAGFHGSTGAMVLNAPIVGMEVTPSGNGYWLVAADGGAFAFGDAPFVGAATDAFSSSVAGLAMMPSGLRVLAEDGSTLDRP